MKDLRFLPNMKRIRDKFLIIVLPPVFLATILFSGTIAVFNYHRAVEEMNRRINDHVALQAAALASPLWNYDYDALQQTLETLNTNPDVTGATVVDEYERKTAQIDCGVSVPGDRLRRLTRMIVFKRGGETARTIGRLTVTYRLDRPGRELWHKLTLDLALILLLAVTIMISALAANRLTVGRPLDHLLTAIRRASTGAGREPVDWPAVDEMGVVIREYNQLLANLSASEEALIASEEKHRLLVERAQECIVVIQDGLLRFVNPKTEDVLGQNREELLGRPFPSLIHPDDRAMVAENNRRRMAGEPVPERYVLRVVRPDGTVRYLETGGLVIEWEGRPATLGFLNDVTERIKADQERIRREKLQAAIETAGAVCHELNQPLQIIGAKIELMLMKNNLDGHLRKGMESLLDQADRMANLTQKLQGLTHYKTREYAEDVKILDIDGSSSDN